MCTQTPFEAPRGSAAILCPLRGHPAGGLSHLHVPCPTPRRSRSSTRSLTGMTDPPGATPDPDIPDAVRREWDELLVTAHRMRVVHAEYEQLRRRAHELVIELLRAGVKRRDLVDRPFSPALLSRIRQREGLPTERRPRNGGAATR